MRVTMEKERIALGNPQDQEQEYRDPVLDLGEGRYLFTCQVCGWAWLGTTKPRRCTRIVKGRHATWWIPRPWLVRGAEEIPVRYAALLEKIAWYPRRGDAPDAPE